MADDAPLPLPERPEDRLRVRILDLSGGAEDGVVEEVGGFVDLDHAEAFARAYVRDSVERCREAAPELDVIAAWSAWGEDAEVLGGGEEVWRSALELAEFAAEPAEAGERDWRAIDPRAMDDEDDDGGAGGSGGAA